MNGAVEAANKNIKKIIQKMVVTYKDWHGIVLIFYVFSFETLFYFSPKYSLHPHRFFLQLMAAQNFICTPTLCFVVSAPN